MKKLINAPYNYVFTKFLGLKGRGDEEDPERRFIRMWTRCLSGCASAHPEYYAQTAEGAWVIKRRGRSGQGQGRSGDGRAARGICRYSRDYVGQGLLDACAIGDVFASPSADQMVEAIHAADGSAGGSVHLRQLRRRHDELLEWRATWSRWKTCGRRLWC